MFEKIKLSVTPSIGRRFIHSLLFIVVIPLIVSLAIFQHSVSQEYHEQSCAINLEILKQTREGLESFTNDIEFVSKNILGDEQVQEYLKIYGGNGTDLGRISVSYTIQPIMQHRPIISTISIFNEEQIYCQFGTLVTEENEEYLDAVKELKGKGLWTSAYCYTSPMLPQNADTYVVSFLRVINDMYSMNPLAIERISMDESSICELYSALNPSEGTMFIVDQEGSIVSSTDKTMLGTQVQIDDYVTPTSGQEGWFLQENRIHFYYWLSNPDWLVIQTVPSNIFDSNTTASSWAFYVCLLLTALFALLFYRTQERTVIRPVKAMVEQTKRFQNGTTKIEMCTTGNDEIAVLNKAFVDMSVSIKQLIEREYKSKLAQKEIELAYMQSQINPHFLYNTLESIRWMAVLRQQPEIADQVEALSRLFRRVLNEGRSTTTVKEELEHVDLYMKLMQNRFGEKLRYEKYVDESLLNCRVLHLVLQPLVENAIVHGIEKKRANGYVRVTVCQSEDSIFYLVEDNGAGANEEQILRQMRNEDASKCAFALRNIDDRIKFRYGEKYGLTFRSAEGRGTTVTVQIPIKCPREDSSDVS